MSTTVTKPQAGAKAPAPAEAAGWFDRSWPPLAALREDVERVFDNFWRGFAAPARRPAGRAPAFWPFEAGFGVAPPAIDVMEGEKEYRISVELPGIDIKDVEIGMSDDVLTIKGEKKDTREETSETYYVSERRFGAFQRAFQIPAGVDRERIEAKFEKGVLHVTMPKTAEAAARQKKIEIKAQG